MQVRAAFTPNERFDASARRANAPTASKMKKWLLILPAMLLLHHDWTGAHENESDLTQNVKIMRPLADKGNPLAQYNLGVLYDSGSGVKRDYLEAAKWYRRSAEQGTPLAQYRLALLYAEGKGVKQNFSRAHMWSSLSAAQGNADARKQLDLIAVRMIPAQIAVAEKLAAECEKRKYRGCE